MLYGKWLNEWLELYVRVAIKERTYKNYVQQANKYILPKLGQYEIADLSAMKLQKFSAGLIEMKLAASTINSIVSILKSSLKMSVSLGLADKQFTDAIVRPRPRVKSVSCFSVAEQKKIEKYIMDKRRPILFGILLSLYSGLRIGELLALTWEDVDFINGTMSINKSCHDSWIKNRYVKVIDTTKTKCSERTIPLPKQFIGYMKMLRKTDKAGKFVIMGKSEYGAQVRSYQRTFGRVLKQLNISHKGFHALRHTFATRALEVGMDIKTLSEILGHRSPTITLQRYAHSMMEHKTEMMNKVGRLLF